ncbi:hypothetical protein CLV42_114140 [Chitinophaga ginsengisoli]|uniref:Uncharacterized protein n=1 Tax=Chitinophaga ginsengisoli TaxID=363837 RepID=A0A2P8FTF8_9BACT|nr:hypothetical protein CLV42_114140 [Chitinophaga ginsengisoli]
MRRYFGLPGEILDWRQHCIFSDAAANLFLRGNKQKLPHKYNSVSEIVSLGVAIL